MNYNFLPPKIRSFAAALSQSRFLKTLFSTTIVISLFSIHAYGQTSSLPNYEMRFRFVDPSGVWRDTMLSRMSYKYWSKSASYPSYVKWKNQPFAVLHSALDGEGLFTDSVSSFTSGQVIGFAFYKIGSSGRFDFDYLESNIGSFINDASNPNMDVVLTSQGILLKANQNISPGTELTASYEAIMNLFPNDQTVQRVIQYW